jgi:uncharacterized protein (TIGR03435 family)
MILVAIATEMLSGQAPMAFEAASIKATPPQVRVAIRSDDSQYEVEGIPLQTLVAEAYRVPADRVTGPAWMKTARFSVLAKFPAGVSRDRLPEMMQTLLAERFKVRVHQETKEFRTYALIVGDHQPKLTPRLENAEAADSVRGVLPMSLDKYAEFYLTGAIGSPVVNMTGLKGEYMMSTTSLAAAARERRLAANAAEKPGNSQGSTNIDPSDSAAFGIVQGLGLKLEPRKVLLPVVVVDSVETSPTEN